MLKFFSKRLNNKKGFTLIELIVVIAILAILALIAVPRIGKFRTKAAISSHNANVRTLMGAATTCLADEGTATTIDWSDDNTDWKDYINSWPTPPKGPDYTKDANPKFVGENKNAVYTVKTNTEGEIVVNPGFIPEEASPSG